MARTIAGQMTRFTAIGIASTAAYVGLLDLLRGVAPAELASAASLTVTTIANTAANRRYTFGLRGRAGRRRALVAGAATFALVLAATSAALAGRAADTDGSTWTTGVILVATSAVAAVMRFSVLRSAGQAADPLCVPSQHSHPDATGGFRPLT